MLAGLKNSSDTCGKSADWTFGAIIVATSLRLPGSVARGKIIDVLFKSGSRSSILVRAFCWLFGFHYTGLNPIMAFVRL